MHGAMATPADFLPFIVDATRDLARKIHTIGPVEFPVVPQGEMDGPPEDAEKANWMRMMARIGAIAHYWMLVKPFVEVADVAEALQSLADDLTSVGILSAVGKGEEETPSAQLYLRQILLTAYFGQGDTREEFAALAAQLEAQVLTGVNDLW